MPSARARVVRGAGAAVGGLAVLDGGCCGSAPVDPGLHARLADLLARHDINEYAASVKVFAVTPPTT